MGRRKNSSRKQAKECSVKTSKYDSPEQEARLRAAVAVLDRIPANVIEVDFKQTLRKDHRAV